MIRTIRYFYLIKRHYTFAYLYIHILPAAAVSMLTNQDNPLKIPLPLSNIKIATSYKEMAKVVQIAIAGTVNNIFFELHFTSHLPPSCWKIN